MTQYLPKAKPSRLPRAGRTRVAIAIASGLLIAAPLLGAPTAAAAAASFDAGLGHRVAHAAPKATGAPSPSIQYAQAMEHAGDVIEFDPGAAVDLPYSPRPGDALQVDGKTPSTLPAGRATGLQMRNAAPGAGGRNGPGRTDTNAESETGADPQPSASPDTSTDTTTDTAITATPASFVTPGFAGDANTAAAVSATGLRREVFGFLPYWELGASTTVLDWRTLSTVAYFSVGCTATGGLAKTDADGSVSTGWSGWTSSKMTSVITAAHRNHTRVVLSISCFAWNSTGASRQAALLGSATARLNFAKAAAAAVRDRGADGINLDFEPIVSGRSAQFTALVRSIRSELNKVAPGYQLTFCTLGAIGNQPIADATAPGGADAVFVMGYDYRTDGSPVAGSISPLTGPRYDLTDTVQAYTARIPASKVILGVPYYGRAWSTGTDTPNASTLPAARFGSAATPTYAEAVGFASSYGRRWDGVEQTPWTAYHKQTCTTAYGCVTSWRELYYDDAASLKLRYDLINRAGLRGAGIWALGFDGTRPELRAALAAKFLVDRTAPVAGIVTLAQQQRDEGFRVAWTSWDDSTVANYDIQVAVNGRGWSAWLTRTTLTSAIFRGTSGRTYAFRVRATDAHGNVGAWNATVSATATGVPDGIAPGGFASVLVDGLRMRAAPSTDGAIMTTLDAGDALQVLAGPVAADGYSWFQVAGPVRQWAPVDPMQVGGWVAASGNGATNAGARRPVYATTVAAGITDMAINGGGLRAVTPNRDGSADVLRLTWTNHRAFDSLALRVFKLDGTRVGSVALSARSTGPHAYDWNGRVGGAVLPDGAYVLQLEGIDGGVAFHAPSASPVTPEQVRRTGVMVGDAVPTAIVAFNRPASPTRTTGALSWTVHFGGPVTGLTAADFNRSGTARSCVLGAPVGAGATWTISLTGCSAGTVTLGLKASAVVDAVGNPGPASAVAASPLLIDRTAPTASAPRVSLRNAVSLPSTAANAGVLATVNLAAVDRGGAGVGGHDLRRSTDGGAFTSMGVALTAASVQTTLIPGHSYRFQVRARDKAGNVGAWTLGPTLRAYLPQQTSSLISWKGTWTSATDAHASGGSVRYAVAAGASVAYSFSGRAIAWVTTLGPTRGAAKVYVDGVFTTTVDLVAPAAAYGRIAFARSWSASGWHSIRIVVVGTAGRPRIDVDAFEVLR